MAESHVSSSNSSIRRTQRKRKHDATSSGDEYSVSNILIESSDRESNMASSESNDNIDSRPHVIGAQTCDWCKDTLDTLNISTIVTRSYSPLTLIEMIRDLKIEEKKTIDKCKGFIFDSTNPLNCLNYNDMEEDDLDLEELKTLQMKFRHRWYRDASKKNEPGGWLERFSEKFRVHGEEFAQQLLYMNFIVKKEQRLLEAMYKTLFGHFAAMFGLSSFREPALTGMHMAIGKTEVTSIPDMIFPDFVSTLNESDEEMKILAVGEVKRDFMQFEDSTDKLPRSNNKQERVVTNHIESNLHGQVGGQLLLHLPLSTYPGLLGIIIQKTNVTFSFFDCKKIQFDEIKEGQFNFPNKPYIYYSQPLNFLKASDRNKLVEPLLRLGFLQGGPM